MVLLIPEIIRKKRDGLQLSTEEIEFFIESVVTCRIDDSQTGAMLMAMYLNKLSIGETISLTKSMICKGATLTFANYNADVLVDKHSTGGVGDKISLILAPALAACGLKVPMISGRGLGYTGGTLDKLESIPGFQVHLNLNQMNECLDNSGYFICGAAENIAPADGILYKIRDATSTVEDSSLIVASILSKKAAEGIGTLVMDVKFGKGASIPTEAEARKMAGLMKEVGEELNLKVRAVISDMNVPLGKFIGNSLEVVESIMCLRNEVSNSVTELTNFLGGVALVSKGKATTVEEGKQMIRETLKNSTALGCFRKMLACQGVQDSHIEALCSGNYWSVLPKASYTTLIQSPEKGVVVSIDALNIGRACWLMGAGRLKPNSKIDHSVGVVLLKTVGDLIEKGEPWIEVHHAQKDLQMEVKNLIDTSLKIEERNRNFDVKLKAYLL